MIPSYVKDSTVAVVCYDTTDAATFESVRKWVEDAVSMRGEEVIIILAGNKIDMENNRKVSTEDGQKLASELNAMFFETSAKEGTNVKTLFNELAKKLIGVETTEEEDIGKKGLKLKDVREDPHAGSNSAGGEGAPKEKCGC